MWVVFTHDLTDDTGGFDSWVRGFPAVFVHGVKNTAVDWFQTIADVWQGAVNDNGHGVLEEVVFHGMLDGLVLNSFLRDLRSNPLLGYGVARSRRHGARAPPVSVVTSDRPL